MNVGFGYKSKLVSNKFHYFVRFYIKPENAGKCVLEKKDYVYLSRKLIKII